MQKYFRDQLLKSPLGSKWKKIGIEDHHGIVLMLSSLHSKNSHYIGEFYDLIPMISWCSEIGLDFIQLLPLNDTGLDNSPYNPISTLALNPVYLSLINLPFLTAREKKELSVPVKLGKYVNYSLARGKKFGFLRKYFDAYFTRVEKLKNYSKFLKENPWIDNYALFCTLSEEHQTMMWKNWPESVHKLSSAAKNKLLKSHAPKINFYRMIQYFCFEQLKHVHQCAQKKKVLLHGDLPFLVSRDSCVFWSDQNLFLDEFSVGSPPDGLTPEGQNWEFPAYNWDRLKKTKYAWWTQRLKVAENFFDMYRLDHIIGFFRTWNIPKGKTGREGAFNPEDPNEWLEMGARFLKHMIHSSEMLPIGEDLVIPQTIKDVLRELGICGTNILTWQRTGAGGADFVHPPLYVAATITHVASHDTVTLSQWWKKYPKVAQFFCHYKGWKYTPHLSRDKRFDILYDSHHTSSIFHANLLQETLALFPEMVHKNHNDERINYPGTPSKNNWRYRLIPSIEQIVSSRKLSHAFKKIIH